jgi:hypothetical protein
MRYEERHEQAFLENLPDKMSEQVFPDLAHKGAGFFGRTCLTFLGSGWEILDARCTASTSPDGG